MPRLIDCWTRFIVLLWIALIMSVPLGFYAKSFGSENRSHYPLRVGQQGPEMVVSDSLGPSVDLGGSVIFGAAGASQVEPSVVWADSVFFAVWRDSRLGHYEDIFGARISPDGTVRDTLGIPIYTEGVRNSRPAVALGSTNFLVVWDHYGGPNGIRGIRVSHDGTVLDPSPFMIADSYEGTGYPAVAFDGSRYFVSYHDAYCDFYDPYTGECLIWLDEIWGKFVDQSGNVFPGPRLVSSSYCVYRQDIAFDGANYFAVWIEADEVRGQFMDTSGTLIGSEILICSEDIEGGVSVCYLDSHNYLVVWSDLRNGESDVFGARVSPGRVVLDPGGFPICASPGSQSGPSTCPIGDRYLVTWTDDREGTLRIYASRVASSGAPLDSTGIPLLPSGDHTSLGDIAASDTLSMLVWQDYATGYNWDSDIFGSRLDSSGTSLDSSEILISSGFNNQMSVKVGFDGTNYMMVWSDSRGDSAYSIYGTFVDPQGVLLDSSGILVGLESDHQSVPDIAFDGLNYLVVWQGTSPGSYYSDICCTRVTPEGILLDEPCVRVTESPSISDCTPAVAFGGANYLITWYGGGGILAARVSTDGSLLDPSGMTIAATAYTYPDVGFDGTNYLVVYSAGSSYNRNIYGKRVSPSGVILDPTAISICTASSNQEYPAVSFGDTAWLAVWQDGRGGIYGTRVTSGGTVLDPSNLQICTANDYQGRPQVCFDGVYFLVAWQDERSGLGSDIYCSRVTTSGVVADPGGLLASDAVGDQTGPALCAGGQGGALVAYTSLIDQLRCRRIWGNVWRPAPAGVSESDRVRVSSAVLCVPAPTVFSAVTQISFALPQASRVALQVYDVSGRLVKTLADAMAPQGMTTLAWYGSDQEGEPVSSGVYFVRLRGEGFALAQKVVCLR